MKKHQNHFFNVFATLVFILCLAMSSIGLTSNQVQAVDVKQQLTVSNTVGDYMGLAGAIDAPCIVQTLEGESVKGVYRFQSVQAMQDFIVGKHEQGLRVTNSHNPKRNIIIMDLEDAKIFSKLAMMANASTANQKEGPTYQVEVLELNTPAGVAEKLNAIGIENPVYLLVDSGKKVQPGGIWAQVTQAIMPFQMGADIYNNIRSISLW